MSTVTDASAPEPATPLRGGRLSRLPRGFLGIVMLLTGAAGLIYEYVLSTVFTYMLGGSIEQFSITIGVMFVMMGMGGLIQPKLRGSLPLYFIGAELLLVLLGGFSPVALEWAFANVQPDFAAIKLLYPGLIGLLIGAEIPLAMRINERFTRNLSTNIAGTWAFDYIGGAIGVGVWLWALYRFVPLTWISFLVGGVNLLVAVGSLVFFWARGLIKKPCTGRALTIVAVLGVIATLIFGMTQATVWESISVQKLYEDPIIFHQTTKYQDIVLTQGVSQESPEGKNYSLFLNGNKQFSSDDEAIYHEHLVHPAMNLAARHARVLILGGGDGLAMREVLKYKDVRSVTLVDIDPAMINLSRTNPIMVRLNHGSFLDARVHASASPSITDTGRKQDVEMETGQTTKTDCSDAPTTGDTVDGSGCYDTPVMRKAASVNIYNVDADRFVSTPQQPYDVVIIDLPDPDSVELAKLYSEEFYHKVRQAMAPDGMLVVQATSPYHAKEAFLCVLRTLAAAGFNVVPYHANVPSFGDWGWVLGSPTMPAKELYSRALGLHGYGVPTQQLTAQSMEAALIFGKNWLVTSETRVSTLMNPIIYGLYNYYGWKID